MLGVQLAIFSDLLVSKGGKVLCWTDGNRFRHRMEAKLQEWAGNAVFSVLCLLYFPFFPVSSVRVTSELPDEWLLVVL